MSQGPIVSKFDQKSPKGSVPNGQLKFANCYAIRWFKCKLKPPKNRLYWSIFKCPESMLGVLLKYSIKQEI